VLHGVTYQAPVILCNLKLWDLKFYSGVDKYCSFMGYDAMFTERFTNISADLVAFIFRAVQEVKLLADLRV